jgi:hypothetical protein
VEVSNSAGYGVDPGHRIIGGPAGCRTMSIQAVRANQALAFSALASSHPRRIGLDLVAAIEAPHDQPHVSRSGVA